MPGILLRRIAGKRRPHPSWLERRKRGRYQAEYTEQYRQEMARIREAVPDIALSTDLMVGFPGETDEQFENSLRFCDEIAFSSMHLFKYSPRQGTPAAGYPNQVPNEVKDIRSKRMQEMAERNMLRYMEAHLGQIVEVLVDGFDEEQEQFYGRTYADSPEIDSRVWIASQEALVEGTFVKVCIDGVVDGELSGYIMED